MTYLCLNERMDRQAYSWTLAVNSSQVNRATRSRTYRDEQNGGARGGKRGELRDAMAYFRAGLAWRRWRRRRRWARAALCRTLRGRISAPIKMPHAAQHHNSIALWRVAPALAEA